MLPIGMRGLSNIFSAERQPAILTLDCPVYNPGLSPSKLQARRSLG